MRIKPCLILFMVVAIGGAVAEPARVNPLVKKSAKAETTAPRQDATPVLTRPVTTNTVLGARVAYSGVAVQVLHTDHPLQLLNPFAPESYGSGEGNLLRDTFKRNSDAIKFFSISF